MAPLERRAFLTAGAGLVLGGCSAPAYRSRDTDDGGAAATETPRVDVSRSDATGVETRWDTFVPGRYTLSTPAVTDDALYIGSAREIHRLSITDGKVDWSAPLGTLSHRFTPAVRDETVFAAARNMVGDSLMDGADSEGTLAAIDTADGSERWRVSPRVTGAPTLASDQVLVPTTDDEVAHVRAYDSATGDLQWVSGGLEGRALAAATVAGDVAMVPVSRGDRGLLAAVDLEDGNRGWSVETGAVAASVDVANGTVYAGTADGRLHAFALADGSRVWERNLGDGIYTRPVVVGETLYVAVGETVRALATHDGRERWRTTVGSVSRTGVGVDADGVYVGGSRITGLAAGTGEQRWSQELEGVAGTFGAPAVSDGVVYTGACVKAGSADPYDHHVYALAETER